MMQTLFDIYRLLVLSLKNMIKWLVFLMLLVTATATFIPCCESEECCLSETSSDKDHNEEKSNGICSPLCAATSCHSVVELCRTIQFIVSIPSTIQVFTENLVKYHPTFYCTSFWQPPRTIGFI